MRDWFGAAPKPSVSSELNFYDLKDLHPILVPKEFEETGAWVGPVERLDVDGLDLTWGVLTQPNIVNYLDREMIANWEGQEVDWRAASMQNLRRLAGDRPWSHELQDGEGRMVLVCFLHEDGFGPSRLLIPDLLNTVFPNGYEVAIPELICAVAVGKVGEIEDARAEALIQSCFENGTRPVSPRRYAPETFWVL